MNFDTRKYVIISFIIVVGFIYTSRLFYMQVIDDSWALRAQQIAEKRKEIDKFGNDWVIYNGQSKEQRAEKAKKEYCGNGKEYVWEAKKEFAQNKQELEPNDENLPF